MMKDRRIRNALIVMAVGLALFAGGVALTVLTLSVARLFVYLFAWALTAVGIAVACYGAARLLPGREAEIIDHRSTTAPKRRRATHLILAGLAGILLGFGLARVLHDPDGPDALTALAIYAPVLFGAAVMALGLWQWLPLDEADHTKFDQMPMFRLLVLRIVAWGSRFLLFVAWRYLLNRQHRITHRTKLAMVILIGLRVLLWKGFGVGARFGGLSEPLHVIGVATLLVFLVVSIWGVLRYSRLTSFVCFFGICLGLLCIGIAVIVVIAAGTPSFSMDDHGRIQYDLARQVAGVLVLVAIGCFLAAWLSWFLGMLRGFFTFFTTVPIGGVWIGTAALVVVLAVMSGFESDLRDKILGSNAHIQVTREDGEFTDWRAVKTKIDNIPGVVASTPYAVSEVVIAANNNGMNVIIKGIDPDTVAKVTDLKKDLEDPDSMQRLRPLVDVTRDRTTVQTPRKPDAKDPPPPDMVTGGDPIDFSGPTDDPGTPDAGTPAPPKPDPKPDPKPAPKADATGSGSSIDTEPVTPYGGDATRVIEPGGADWLPDSDLFRWAIGEEDEELPVAVIDDRGHVIGGPLPESSTRTQALPGILVGRELVKQTHLFTGEEVRVVSPLSDPSNPDATGTPIPFNRDYRVAGVFYTGMYEYDLKFVYVTLDSLQAFLDLGDAVDGIEVRVSSPDDTDRYTDEGGALIRQALGPGYRVQDWKELNRSLFSALKLEKIAMFLVLGIVILVASFSIIGNLIMVVVEKAREIALIKTLGASDAHVMQLFAIQGLIIGLIGTALGVATGLGGCALLDEFGLPLDPDVYYINRLPIHVDTQSVIAAAITGVLISIAATLYPALLAARVRPADGMRH